MKKTITFVIALFATTSFLFAAHGWGPAAVEVTADTENGGLAYLYKIRTEGPWTNIDRDIFDENVFFDAANFGTPTTLILNGARLAGNADGTNSYGPESFRLRYRVYPASITQDSQKPAWEILALPYEAVIRNNNRQYTNVGDADIDILAMATDGPGLYKFEVEALRTALNNGSPGSLYEGGVYTTAFTVAAANAGYEYQIKAGETIIATGLTANENTTETISCATTAYTLEKRPEGSAESYETVYTRTFTPAQRGTDVTFAFAFNTEAIVLTSTAVKAYTFNGAPITSTENWFTVNAGGNALATITNSCTETIVTDNEALSDFSGQAKISVNGSNNVVYYTPVFRVDYQGTTNTSSWSTENLFIQDSSDPTKFTAIVTLTGSLDAQRLWVSFNEGIGTSAVGFQSGSSNSQLTLAGLIDSSGQPAGTKIKLTVFTTNASGDNNNWGVTGELLTVSLTAPATVLIDETITLNAASEYITNPIYTYSVKVPGSDVFVSCSSSYQPEAVGTYTFKVEVAENDDQGIVLATDIKEVIVKEPVVVKVKIPTEWGSTVSLSWRDGLGDTGIAQAVYSDGWYSYTFDRAVQVIFINGTEWDDDVENNEDKQTVSISISASNCYQIGDAEYPYDSNYGKRTVNLIDCADVSTDNLNRLNNTAAIVGIDNNQITADFEGTKQIQLYTVSGQLLYAAVVENKFSHTVKSGVYLLRIDGQTYKLLAQ